VRAILTIFVLWFSHILTMGVGAYVVTGEYTPTCLIFFYKGFGNVKGTLYLCSVMKLIDSPTHIKRLNKVMRSKLIDCDVNSFFYESITGYYSLHVKKGNKYTPLSLYLKFNITECLYKRHYWDIGLLSMYRGNERIRNINITIRYPITMEGCRMFLKHFGIKSYELDTTMIVWPTRK
jgi:hypothetical protein